MTGERRYGLWWRKDGVAMIAATRDGFVLTVYIDPVTHLWSAEVRDCVRAGFCSRRKAQYMAMLLVMEQAGAASTQSFRNRDRCTMGEHRRDAPCLHCEVVSPLRAETATG